MKHLILISVVCLFAITGCGGSDQSQLADLITVDVTQTYPKKEIILQDYMDVEYIPLESSEEFVTTAWPHAIGNEVLIFTNRNRFSADGNIYLFDRRGKALRKINRKGQGDEEYAYPLGITLDEENNELFVNDHWKRKIFVYDLAGEFKRSFNYTKERDYGMGVCNFDRENLLCCAIDGFRFQKPNVFLILSKKDGSITKEIELPRNNIVSSVVFSSDSSMLMPIRNRTLVPLNDNNWMLMESSSNRVYRLKSDYSMTPVIERTPLIETMSPGVFLFPAVLTDRYCFMQTVKGEWDFGTNRGHKRVNLMYNKQEKTLFEYVLHNADIVSEDPITMTSEITVGSSEIALVKKLEAPDLVEAYGQGKLNGKLKEIAATLDEESNPVLMLVKYKKGTNIEN